MNEVTRRTVEGQRRAAGRAAAAVLTQQLAGRARPVDAEHAEWLEDVYQDAWESFFVAERAFGSELDGLRQRVVSACWDGEQ